MLMSIQSLKRSKGAHCNGKGGCYASKVFDLTWESVVPFTIVLADDKVVYRHEVAADIPICRAMLANLSDADPGRR
jgi:hypothetical protein